MSFADKTYFSAEIPNFITNAIATFEEKFLTA